jgi:hypothetical protein
MGSNMLERANNKYSTLHYHAAVTDYLATFEERGDTAGRVVTVEDILGFAAVRIGERGLSARAFKGVLSQLKMGLTHAGYTWSPEIDERRQEIHRIIGSAWPAPDSRKPEPIDIERLTRALDRLPWDTHSEAATILAAMLALGFGELLRGHDVRRIARSHCILGANGPRRIELPLRKTNKTDATPHEVALDATVGQHSVKQLVRQTYRLGTSQLTREGRLENHDRHLFPFVDKYYNIHWNKCWTTKQWADAYRGMLTEPTDSEETIRRLTPHGVRSGGADKRARIDGEDLAEVLARGEWVPGSKTAKKEYIDYAAGKARAREAGKRAPTAKPIIDDTTDRESSGGSEARYESN